MYLFFSDSSVVARHRSRPFVRCFGGEASCSITSGPLKRIGTYLLFWYLLFSKIVLGCQLWWSYANSVWKRWSHLNFISLFQFFFIWFSGALIETGFLYKILKSTFLPAMSIIEGVLLMSAQKRIDFISNGLIFIHFTAIKAPLNIRLALSFI